MRLSRAASRHCCDRLASFRQVKPARKLTLHGTVNERTCQHLGGAKLSTAHSASHTVDTRLHHCLLYMYLALALAALHDLQRWMCSGITKTKKYLLSARASHSCRPDLVHACNQPGSTANDVGRTHAAMASHQLCCELTLHPNTPYVLTACYIHPKGEQPQCLRAATTANFTRPTHLPLK